MARLFLAVAVLLEYATGVAGIELNAKPDEMIQKHITGTMVMVEAVNYVKNVCETRNVERETKLLAALKSTASKDKVYASFVDDMCDTKEVTLDVTFPDVASMEAMTIKVPDDMCCNALTRKIVGEMMAKDLGYSFDSFTIKDQDCKEYKEELETFGGKLMNAHKIKVKVLKDVSVTVTLGAKSATNKVKSPIDLFWLRNYFTKWLELPEGTVVDKIMKGNTEQTGMVTLGSDDKFTVTTKTGTALKYKYDDPEGTEQIKTIPGFLSSDMSDTDKFADNLNMALCMLHPQSEHMVIKQTETNPVEAWIGKPNHYKRKFDFAVAAVQGPLSILRSDLNTNTEVAKVITSLKNNLVGFVKLGTDETDNTVFEFAHLVSSCAIAQLEDVNVQERGEIYSFPIMNKGTQGCFAKRKECCDCENNIADTGIFCVEPWSNKCTAMTEEASCSPAVQCDASCDESDKENGEENWWFIDNCTSDYVDKGTCDTEVDTDGDGGQCKMAPDYCPDTQTVSHAVLFAMNSANVVTEVPITLVNDGKSLKVVQTGAEPGSYSMYLTVFYYPMHHTRLPGQFYTTFRTQKFIATVPQPPAAQVSIFGPKSSKAGCGSSLQAQTMYVPEGKEVEYAWTCDVEVCKNLVKDMKTSSITITGLAVGKYKITVNVNDKAEDAEKLLASAEHDLDITTDGAGKVLTLPNVAEVIPLSYVYEIPALADDGCRGAFEAWYLVPGDDSEVKTLVAPAAKINYKVELNFKAEDFDAKKKYRLRVTYGSSAETALDQTMYGETNEFMIASDPPTGGAIDVSGATASDGFLKINVVVSNWVVNNAACANKPLWSKVQMRKTDNEEWIDLSVDFKTYTSGEVNMYTSHQGGALKFRSFVKDCVGQTAEVVKDVTIATIDYTAVTAEQTEKQFENAKDAEEKIEFIKQIGVAYVNSAQVNADVLTKVTDEMGKVIASTQIDAAVAETLMDAIEVLHDAGGSTEDSLGKVLDAFVKISSEAPPAKAMEFVSAVKIGSKVVEALSNVQTSLLEKLTVANQAEEVITQNTQSRYGIADGASLNLGGGLAFVQDGVTRAVDDGTKIAVTKITNFDSPDTEFATTSYEKCKTDDGNLYQVQAGGDGTVTLTPTSAKPKQGNRVVMMKTVSDKEVEAGCETKWVNDKPVITCPIKKGDYTMNPAECSVKSRSFDSGADRTAASFVISTAIVVVATALTQ